MSDIVFIVFDWVPITSQEKRNRLKSLILQDIEAASMLHDPRKPDAKMNVDQHQDFNKHSISQADLNHCNYNPLKYGYLCELLPLIAQKDTAD